MNECTEDRFLKDVSDHQMAVILDDETNRHIRFRKPGTICYGFDLITWPGHLCIAGDCGTYVFSHIKDMFGFFRAGDWWGKKERKETLFINPVYWGEKLRSIGTNAGYKEFAGGVTERYTFHYIWCLYAIAWGIQQYDAELAKAV